MQKHFTQENFTQENFTQENSAQKNFTQENFAKKNFTQENSVPSSPPGCTLYILSVWLTYEIRPGMEMVLFLSIRRKIPKAIQLIMLAVINIIGNRYNMFQT